MPGITSIEIGDRSDLLLQMLEKLGVKVVSPSGHSNPVITRETCERAGVSFEFFKAFARLTQPSKEARVQQNWGTSYFESHDRQLDRAEIASLVLALWALDPENRSSPRDANFQNIAQVKSRINLLGKNPCWLSDESLKMGLLASLHGNLVHEISWTDDSDIDSRSIIPPFEFGCKYLPEMDPLVHDLSYDPNQMPSKIQRAANATVSISVEGELAGSGVMVVYPGYILTARHVIEDIPKYKLKVGINQGGQISTVQVMDVERIYFGDDLSDLAILYVEPNIPLPAPLQFSDTVRPKQDIYLLGMPTQRANTLVQVGVVDGTAGKKSFFSRTTAIGLPGDSGGPVVDSMGNVAGITIGLVKTKPTIDSSVKRAKIIGSGMYRMDVLGRMIKAVIEEDREIKGLPAQR